MAGPKQLPLFGSPATPESPDVGPGSSQPDGASAFSLIAPPDGRIRPASPSPAAHRVAQRLPPELRLGTSSWSFSGWKGVVYEGEHSSRDLARNGLRAYASHPLLRTVGLDRTYYAPMAAADLRELASQTPPEFRFMVKAHEVTTLRRFPDHPRYGRRAGQSNPRFLETEYALREVVEPTVSGLGGRLGVLLFQFAPQNLGNNFPFCERLSRFLSRMPSGVPIAIELRTPRSFTEEYVECLADAGAAHSLLVHPSMPSVDDQWALTAALEGPVLVRWMLRRDRSYQEARAEFAPFDRIALADDASRDAIVRVIEACAEARRPITVIANNKAEGSSPLSLGRLAQAFSAVSPKTK